MVFNIVTDLRLQFPESQLFFNFEKGDMIQSCTDFILCLSVRERTISPRLFSMIYPFVTGRYYQ
jgi:hypothetical protein